MTRELNKFSKTLGGKFREVDTLNENVNPDESQAQDQIAIFDNIKINQSLKIYGKELPNAFVLDHPVLGDLGNSDYPFNYGYPTYSLSMTVTMPINIGVKKELIYDSEA